MSDQLANRARRAAEEIAENLFDLRDITIDGDEMRSTDKDGVRGRGSKEWVVFGFTNIIERHMQIYEGMKMAEDKSLDLLARDSEVISKRFGRCDLLERALTDAYAKLDEAKSILGKIL